MSTARYRIHPAIGIARVGNAPASEYFVGPEMPGQTARENADIGTAVPPYKSKGAHQTAGGTVPGLGVHRSRRGLVADA